MEHFTLITAIVGLMFGFVGAVLGIINTWRAFDRDKVRIKIVPQLQISLDNPDRLAVQIINLSAFPITITRVGFTVFGSDMHMAFSPSDLAGCQLPQRLESRAELTVRFPRGTHQHPDFSRVQRVYADTACGLHITGTSRLLDDLIKKASSTRR